MIQEYKNILLRDLCARMPYEVKCKYYNVYENCYEEGTVLGFERKEYIVINGECAIAEEVRPYLFPLSSMTEEQQEEFDRIYADDMQVVANNLKNRLDGKPYETNLGHYRHIDWLNKNHFDYRGLIEKRLAIDATGLNIY